MRTHIHILLLILACITIDVAQARSDKGKRIATRIAQALNFKADIYALPKQLLVTTALACTMLACGSMKPALYNIGLLEANSAMRAETTVAKVLAAQRNFDSDGTGTVLIRNHIYVHKPTEFGHKTVLASIVKAEAQLLTIQIYPDKFKLTINPDSVKAYLIDDHPNVGREISIPSEQVGISHFNGTVFGVYSNGMHAINLTSKIALDGTQIELHGKDDAPHIRYAYEHQLH